MSRKLRGDWLLCGLLAFGLVGCGGTAKEGETKDGNTKGGADGQTIGTDSNAKPGDGQPGDSKPAGGERTPPKIAVGEPIPGAAPWLRFVGSQHVAAAVVQPKRITESKLFAALPEGLDFGAMEKNSGVDVRHTVRVLYLAHAPNEKQMQQLRDGLVERRPGTVPRDNDEKRPVRVREEGTSNGRRADENGIVYVAQFDDPAEAADAGAGPVEPDEFEKQREAMHEALEQEPPGIADQTVIVWLDEPVDQQAFLASQTNPWNGEPKKIDVDGHEAWQLDPRSVILFLDETTILRASLLGTRELLAAKQANGPIAARLAAAGDDYDAMYVIDVETRSEMRDLLRKSYEASGPKMPPNMKNVPDAVAKIDAMVGRLDLSDEKTLATIRLEVQPSDVAMIETEVKNALELGKGMFQLLGFGLPRDSPPEAREGLAMAGKIVNGVTVASEGHDVVVSAPRPAGLVEFVEKMGPQILRAQETAKLMQFKNNLKQVGLAFHNFYDTFRFAPASAAYATADGKPLLSWRVAVLPQLEEANLFEQFDLVQAWDGETNKSLLDQMPDIYKSPGVDDPTKTTLMVLTGPSTIFDGKHEIANESLVEGPKFAEITDGMSNTILAVYAHSSKAVPWTQPQDLAFDPEKPLESVGEIPETGLMVLMWDGSVRSLPKGIAADVFKNAVEHNDGNLVDLP